MTPRSRDDARAARLPRALAFAAVMLLAAPYLEALPAAAGGPGVETISGVVFDEHGQPKEAVAVSCTRCPEGATTGADGSFSLGGTDIDGDGVLSFLAAGYLTAEVPFDLQDGGSLFQTVYLVETVGPDTGTITGTVTSIEGEPLEGARVTLEDDRDDVDTTETAADGSFAFEDVPAGDDRSYRVTAEARGFELGSDTAKVERAGTIRVDIVLALEGNAEVLKGRVVDSRGLPLPGALVGIGGVEGVWATDLGGSYRVQSVGLGGAHMVVASLQGYVRTSVRAKVPPQGLAWANITLLTDGMGGPESVWVAVSEASHGTPVEGAVVSVEGKEGTWTTDARGLAVGIADGLQGPRELTARHEGFTRATASVELEDGGTASVAIAIVEASNACVLAGTVIDASTRGPIEGARVAVDASGISRSTVTGPSGSYSIFALPPGVDTEVTFAADGHAASTLRTQLREFEPNVLDMALAPETRRTVDVEGLVHDAHTGAPVAGAWVTLWDAVPMMVLRTDALGRFSAQGVPAEGDTLSWLVEGQAYSAASGGVALGEGGSVAIDVSLAPVDPPQTAVTGWVRDVDGLPVRGARVSLEFAQRTWETVADRVGTYAIFLSIGSDFTGELSATADGYGWHNQTPMLRARVANWVNFTVPLGPGFGNVLGHVSAGGSLRPIEGAEVFLSRGGAFHEAALTGEGGDFAFQRLPVADGPYELSVVREGYDGANVEALVLPGGTVFFNLTVREDVPTTETLVGILTSRSGMPLPGAVAMVAGFEPAVTDQEGRFVISDALLEGARTLVATAPGFSPASVQVDIVPGATAWANLTLDVSPADFAIVTGTVASARDGRPLEGALVQLGWEGSGGWALEARTGRNGSFTLLGVPASRGRISVTASMEGYRTDTAELEVQAGSVTQSTLALSPAEPAVKERPVMSQREKAVIGVSAGAAAATIGALLATEVGRVALMGLLLVPLYTKIRRERMMDHFVRGRIYEHICQNPGVNYSAIKQRFNLTNGTVTYHLLMLERQEFIRSRQDGIYKRYFKEGTGASLMEQSPMSLQRAILRIVGERPGISQKDIARELGSSKQLVSYYIRNLRKEGLVETHRSGRSVLVFQGPARLG
jgi:DNA-binding MarR family transcriptional regulator/protocatechuate 3,4-dioxygenase beta subunit